jgi:hypothetical protein
MVALGRSKWLDGPQEFISVKEAATFLSCSIELIYDAIHTPPPTGLPHKMIITENSKRITYRIPKKEFLIWAHDYSSRRKRA